MICRSKEPLLESISSKTLWVICAEYRLAARLLSPNVLGTRHAFDLPTIWTVLTRFGEGYIVVANGNSSMIRKGRDGNINQLPTSGSATSGQFT